MELAGPWTSVILKRKLLNICIEGSAFSLLPSTQLSHILLKIKYILYYIIYIYEKEKRRHFSRQFRFSPMTPKSDSASTRLSRSQSSKQQHPSSSSNSNSTPYPHSSQRRSPSHPKSTRQQFSACGACRMRRYFSCLFSNPPPSLTLHSTESDVISKTSKLQIPQQVTPLVQIAKKEVSDACTSP